MNRLLPAGTAPRATPTVRHRVDATTRPRRAGQAALLALALAWQAPAANAQQQNNDYYDPQNATLLRTVETYHLYPGQERIRNREYEHAFGDFVFILRYFPNHPQALVQMVQLCTEWKSPKCYLDPMFEAAIARRPDVASTYVTLGIYYHRNKKYADAIGAYKKALGLDPDSMNGHYNLGLAYVATKDYAKANVEAQSAYALGAPLPGLRDQLIKAKAWDPSAAPAAAAAPAEKTSDAKTPAAASQ